MLQPLPACSSPQARAPPSASGTSRLASVIRDPQDLSCLSPLSCEPLGPGLCCFLSSVPQAAFGSPQIIINLGIKSVEGDFASLSSSLDLFLFVCADKREHVVASQEARLELPGSLAIRYLPTPGGGSGGLVSVDNHWSCKGKDTGLNQRP